MELSDPADPEDLDDWGVSGASSLSFLSAEALRRCCSITSLDDWAGEAGTDSTVAFVLDDLGGSANEDLLALPALTLADTSLRISSRWYR